MAKILIINGPNLNLLGRREPGIYGSSSMDDVLASLRKEFPAHEILYFQSNHEGEMIDRLHQAWDDPAIVGVAMNAGAYTHTSLALHDAVAAITIPVVEVHISNIHSREEVRHRSMIAPACAGVIAGFGTDSYRLAISALLRIAKVD